MLHGFCQFIIKQWYTCYLVVLHHHDLPSALKFVHRSEFDHWAPILAWSSTVEQFWKMTLMYAHSFLKKIELTIEGGGGSSKTPTAERSSSTLADITSTLLTGFIETLIRRLDGSSSEIICTYLLGRIGGKLQFFKFIPDSSEDESFAWCFDSRLKSAHGSLKPAVELGGGCVE